MLPRRGRVRWRQWAGRPDPLSPTLSPAAGARETEGRLYRQLLLHRRFNLIRALLAPLSLLLSSPETWGRDWKEGAGGEWRVGDAEFAAGGGAGFVGGGGAGGAGS